MLCNWTVTFYSLPELSPVFGTTQVRNCNWIGGVDLNEGSGAAGDDRSRGVTILLSLNRRIQVIRIGEDARVVRVRYFSSHVGCRADSGRKSTSPVVRSRCADTRSPVWLIPGVMLCWI